MNGSRRLAGAGLGALLVRANAARRAVRVDTAAEAALEAVYGCGALLAVYGTLAPGRSNHGELAMCPGTWLDGAVNGRLVQRDYPFLTPDALAPAISVQLLRSEALRAHWAQLDAFEGDEYRRVLVPVRTDRGVFVANVYVAATA